MRWRASSEFLGHGRGGKELVRQALKNFAVTQGTRARVPFRRLECEANREDRGPTLNDRTSPPTSSR